MFQKKNQELVRDGLRDLELERVWEIAGLMEQGQIHRWHLAHRLVCPASHSNKHSGSLYQLTV